MLGRTDSGRRLLLLLIVFVLAAGALVARLGYWQLGQRDELVDSARRQIYYRRRGPEPARPDLRPQRHGGPRRERDPRPAHRRRRST